MINSKNIKKTVAATKKKISNNHEQSASKPLGALADKALSLYFKNLNGYKPAELYQLVIGEVEKPLFRTVMNYTSGNQSEAAEILGISRGTLRKKLKIYKLLDE
ncbi:MAG: DNA-binding transcriptional regulator Fis [Gammaproteobacteria bacterium]|nr:DNA-binding transcriptional regulator Fis [Gammaproteobacteria bacterium]